MTTDCVNKNPLQRSGVSQYQRVLTALLPGYVQVDERDYADLILFAKNYARQLKYFNAGNVQDGDWSVFMSMDVSVTLASLMKLNVKGSFSYVKEILDKISATDPSQIAILQDHFKVLFDFAFSLTWLMDEYYKAIPDDFEFKAIFGNAIHSNLSAYYDRLIMYYNEANSQSIINSSGTFTYQPQPFEIIPAQNFDHTALSDSWKDTSLPAFSATYNGSSSALKIRNAASHNLFTGIFDQYLKTLANIVEIASTYLDQTLTSFPTHSPHYALFLTFIKLFRFAQDHLNGFTGRHLDLYYKEVLGLTNKDAEPDKVHLTFELAKPADSALIKKDTIFKAGKDSDGQEIFYAATEEVVLNKGAIKSLKNILSYKNLIDNKRQVFAGVVANSEDGLGAKLESTDKSWKTFGSTERTPATVGFVIASHYLYLTEGIRKVTFTFYAAEGSIVPFEASDIDQLFSLQFSGEKAWIDASILTTDVQVDASGDFFTITVTLDGGAPSVVPYNEKVHKLNLNTGLPVAKFTVNDAKANVTVWDFAFGKVGIQVDVAGVKDLVVQNDAGILNPSKPFELFGSAPHVGSAFIVGSKELFMKTMQPSADVAVTLNLTWDNYADLTAKISPDDNPYKVDIYRLEDSVWKPSSQDVQLFREQDAFAFMQGSAFELDSSITGRSFQQAMNVINGNTVAESLGNAVDVNPGLNAGQKRIILTAISSLKTNLPKLDVEPDYTGNEEFTVRSVWGFLKLELGDPEFGHSTYAEEIVEAAKVATITSVTANGKTTTTISMAPVPEPYTPKVRELSIDYTASTIIDFTDDEEGIYFHLTPFGYRDISADSGKTLLPVFNNEGELLIGVEKFITGQTLSVLFQVAEGSADPLASKPEMIWYYLGSENKWIEFEKEDITDGTNDLTQSGIIRFSLSDSAVSGNTLMTEQLHWLRGTVKDKTNAVCKLIAVVAQAVTAQLYDYKDQGNYFKQNIAANTISKAVVSEAAIKKITQAYSSFGGRQKESADQFYVRVSERLRHKGRGVSMWDYERLVLEAFPGIYKVKCINHTEIIEKTTPERTVYIDNELKPGGVIIVTIPDLQNKNAYDPLRPYTSTGILTEIKKYLYKNISPHVNLDVRNPRFEEIQLEFTVKYITDEEEFYTKQLREEIEQFLAPWAYDHTRDIEFGGKISKSALINFIEERSYVDYLSCVKMYQIVEGKKSSDIEEAIATSARSVFVSVKSDDVKYPHIISTTDCTC